MIFQVKETFVSTKTIFKENCSLLIGYSWKEKMTGNARAIGAIQSRRKTIYICEP